MDKIFLTVVFAFGITSSLLLFTACGEEYELSNDDAEAMFTSGNKVMLKSSRGNVKTIYTDSERNHGLRTEVAPDGRHFAVYAGERYKLYDKFGQLLGELPITEPQIRHKLIGASPKILVPITETSGIEEKRVMGFSVRGIDGRRYATIDVGEIRFSFVSNDHVTLATQSSVVRASVLGEIIWTFDERARKISVAEQADNTMIVPSSDSREVIHLSKDKIIGRASLGRPIWNISLAPEGRYSVATTQSELHLFENGNKIASRELPIAYAASVAINDMGTAIIGGQTQANKGRVIICDSKGRILRETDVGSDNQAFHPKVEFLDGGVHFTVENADTFSILEATR